MIKSALLVLEDGIRFHDRAIGVTGMVVGEIIFSTSMTGYQEILTDPSYSHQIITLTYPHIGNVGVSVADEEPFQVRARGLVIHDLPLTASNFCNIEDFSSYLKRHNIVAIADTGTRKLTHLLREKGAQNGCIIAGDSPDAQLVPEKAGVLPGLNGMDLAKEVTIAETYSWTQGSRTLTGDLPETKVESELPFHVVAYDFSTKRNTPHMLTDHGCRLTVVSTQTSAEDVLKINSDGVFLSSDPGDPVSYDCIIDTIEKSLETNIPVFSTYLGHQLPALASGAKTIKMKLGYYGGNHPVKDIDNNVVMITTQNHGLAADEATSPANLRVTHKSLFGGTLQGVHRTDRPAFSFQGHSEANPGLHDVVPLFDHFIGLIGLYRQPVE